MKKLVSVYKPIGMTPLEAIEVFRKEFPLYKNEKIGYAGRLDPLAHGILLLMVGDATKERDKYLHLEKTYEFEALFGFETDTYDVMGLASVQKSEPELIVNKKVSVFVNKHGGKFEQSYPPYSSKTVGGKPLFLWARQNRLHEITVPTHEVMIQNFEFLSQNEIEKKHLQQKIHDMIAAVKGDFRQTEILERWDTLFASTKQKSFQTAHFRITCSSGTYVRGLAHELGKSLGTGALALEIKRTHIGTFDLTQAKKLRIAAK